MIQIIKKKKIKKITMKVLNFMFIPSKDEDLSSNFDFLSIFSVPVESKMAQMHLNFSHIISKNKM